MWVWQRYACFKGYLVLMMDDKTLPIFDASQPVKICLSLNSSTPSASGFSEAINRFGTSSAQDMNVSEMGQGADLWKDSTFNMWVAYFERELRMCSWKELFRDIPKVANFPLEGVKLSLGDFFVIHQCRTKFRQKSDFFQLSKSKIWMTNFQREYQIWSWNECFRAIPEDAIVPLKVESSASRNFACFAYLNQRFLVSPESLCFQTWFKFYVSKTHTRFHC